MLYHDDSDAEGAQRPPDRLLSMRDVCELTGWSKAKVIALVRNGFLPAINSSAGKRPTYHLLRSELFRVLKSDAPPKQEPTPKRRRRRIDADVPKVF